MHAFTLHMLTFMSENPEAEQNLDLHSIDADVLSKKINL